MIADVHAPFVPGFVVDDGAALGIAHKDGWLVHATGGIRYPLDPVFTDVEARLARMDAMGIDLTVVSLAPTMFMYDLAPADGAAFARRANDALARLVADGGGRLAGLATLPLQDPDAAIAELERAVAALGLRGAQVGTGVGASGLDALRFEPVLAAAERLDVPLLVHPYFSGPKPGLEDFYMTNTVGNPLDTTLAALRLIHSGALDRLPRLRVLLVHGGGFLPYQLGRYDRAFSQRREPRIAIDRPPSAYLDRFWIDSVTHSDGALRFLAETIGTDMLVLGTDLPFDMADPEPVERAERAGIDPHALGASALQLLGGDPR